MKTLLKYEYLSDEQWNEIAKENNYDIEAIMLWELKLIVNILKMN